MRSTCIGGTRETKILLQSYSKEGSKSCTDKWKMTKDDNTERVQYLDHCAHSVPVKSYEVEHIMESCQSMSLHCFYALELSKKDFCSCNNKTDTKDDFEQCSLYQIMLDHNPCLGYHNASRTDTIKTVILEHDMTFINPKKNYLWYVSLFIGLARNWNNQIGHFNPKFRTIKSVLYFRSFMLSFSNRADQLFRLLHWIIFGRFGTATKTYKLSRGLARGKNS